MADKTKTIKNATDKELDDLMTRLRKENEVQSLIMDLKRKADPKFNNWSMAPYEQTEGVSTEAPIESMYHAIDATLAHFGIKGMQWGRRKANLKAASKKGVSVANALVSAEAKARAKGEVDKEFLAHPNISQKAKDRVVALAAKNKRSDDFEKSRELKAKSYRTLSNKELKDLNNRLQLEKSLRELKTSDNTRGLELVKTLTTVGTTLGAAYALVNSPLGKSVISAIRNPYQYRLPGL